MRRSGGQEAGEFAFGIGVVLNKNAAQCRFVVVATEQAPGFALGTAGLAAESRAATPGLGNCLRAGVEHSGRRHMDTCRPTDRAMGDGHERKSHAGRD